jgi:hypothetical protein
MRRALRILLFVACVFVSVAGAYNVMSDNAEVEKLAAEKACGDQGAGCRAQKTMMERNPIAQTFDFSTPKRIVGVRCTRALIFVGEYTCIVR